MVAGAATAATRPARPRPSFCGMTSGVLFCFAVVTRIARREKWTRRAPCALLDGPKVDTAGAVRTNLPRTVPTVRTNRPKVDTAGVFASRKVDTAGAVRTSRWPESGHGGCRAHFPRLECRRCAVFSAETRVGARQIKRRGPLLLTKPFADARARREPRTGEQAS